MGQGEMDSAQQTPQSPPESRSLPLYVHSSFFSSNSTRFAHCSIFKDIYTSELCTADFTCYTQLNSLETRIYHDLSHLPESERGTTNLTRPFHLRGYAPGS